MTTLLIVQRERVIPMSEVLEVLKARKVDDKHLAFDFDSPAPVHHDVSHEARDKDGKWTAGAVAVEEATPSVKIKRPAIDYSSSGASVPRVEHAEFMTDVEAIPGAKPRENSVYVPSAEEKTLRGLVDKHFPRAGRPAIIDAGDVDPRIAVHSRNSSTVHTLGNRKFADALKKISGARFTGNEKIGGVMHAGAWIVPAAGRSELDAAIKEHFPNGVEEKPKETEKPKSEPVKHIDHSVRTTPYVSANPNAGFKFVKTPYADSGFRDAMADLGVKYSEGGWRVPESLLSKVETLKKEHYQDKPARIQEENRQVQQEAARKTAEGKATRGEKDISAGSGNGGRPFKAGETINHNGQYVTVLSASQQYHREDGMSFGVGDESGYVYHATVRPATDAEKDPIVKKEQSRRKSMVGRHTLSQISSQIARDGNPDETEPKGETFDFSTPNGASEKIVIGKDRIWRELKTPGIDWSSANDRASVPYSSELADQVRNAHRDWNGDSG